MPTSFAISRMVLVPDVRPDHRGDPRIRRFRLARLDVNPPRSIPRETRFAHLKRTHD